MGITLDSKLTYGAHIKYAVEKAATTTENLSRSMANIGGPIASRRKLLMSVTHAILFYGSEVWADTLNADCRRKQMALRVASAYRSVSEAAVLVIAAVTPIDLLAKERKALYSIKTSDCVENGDAEEIKDNTIRCWQERWDTETRLIPNISAWVNKPFGEVNFYLTQLLSGHGYFCKYLYKIGKRDGTLCTYGDNQEDDVVHTFFKCVRWTVNRRELE